MPAGQTSLCDLLQLTNEPFQHLRGSHKFDPKRRPPAVRNVSSLRHRLLKKIGRACS